MIVCTGINERLKMNVMIADCCSTRGETRLKDTKKKLFLGFQSYNGSVCKTVQHTFMFGNFMDTNRRRVK